MERRPKRRITKQRRVILEEVKGVTSHPTADDVYRMVRKRLPKVSLGTVYRNLEALSEWGMLQKLEGGPGPKRFDGWTENHYHIRCLACGRVEDAPGRPAARIEANVRRSTDYEILSHRLEFVGFCPRCRRKRKPKNP